jgi:hypothetical protein
MALGLKLSKADFFREKKCIKIETILYLPHRNRKMKALLDCGTENEIISQRFVKQNGLQKTPVRPMGIAIDRHRVTIYGTHDLLFKVKDYHNVTQYTRRTFYVTDMQHYDIIFSISWLNEINPDVW